MFICKPTPSPDVPSPSSKPSESQAVPQTDNHTNSSAVAANSFVPDGGRLPTLTNIREWIRQQMPEIGLVQDATGTYHLVRSDGGGRGSGSSSSSTKDSGSEDNKGAGNLNLNDHLL